LATYKIGDKTECTNYAGITGYKLHKNFYA